MMDKNCMKNIISWQTLRKSRFIPKKTTKDISNESITLFSHSTDGACAKFNSIEDYETAVAHPTEGAWEEECPCEYLGIFWDMESCQPPTGISVRSIIKKIQQQFAFDSYKRSHFFVVAPQYDIIGVEDSEDDGVKLHHAHDVESFLLGLVLEEANHVANQLCEYALILVSDNIAIINDVIIVTREFASLTLILSEAYEHFSHLPCEVFKFEKFLTLQMNTPDKGPCYGYVSGYFVEGNVDELFNYFCHIFYRHGIVKSVTNTEALIQFANWSLGLDAEDIVHGRKVMGYDIDLTLVGKINKSKCLPSEYSKKPSRIQHYPKTVKPKKCKAVCVNIVIKFDDPKYLCDSAGCIDILEGILGKEIEFEVTNFRPSASNCDAELEALLPSMKKAKEVMRTLNKRCTTNGSSLPAALITYSWITSGVYKDEKKANEKRLEFNQESKLHILKAFRSHNMKIAEIDDSLAYVKDKLKNLSSRKIKNSDKLQSVYEEECTLKAKKDELKEQYTEFFDYTTQLLLKVDCLEVDYKFNNSLDILILSFFRELNYFKNGLPIYAKRSSIVKTIENYKITVLLAETGSGKSTQLVQYLYQNGLHGDKMIVCTQPRKIAVTSLATHVSGQMGSPVGHLVGYKTGTKSKSTESTAIIYMTDHTLLNECLDDPTFTKYSCIIIDEAHERSINTDLLLGMLKCCLRKRHDLKVIITSATIDPKKFVSFFKEFDSCSVVDVPGRVFPVEVIYLPQEEDFKGNYINTAVNLINKIEKQEMVGDILVFLTSPFETERAVTLTSALPTDSLYVLQLHGRLQIDEQQRVFNATPPGKRKVVFATNSAETSITIPGIKYVIDTGVVKEKKYNPQTSRSSLTIGPVSQSSADQRKGRAGRTEPGKCYRLYSQKNYENLESSMLPEILRINLGQAILKLMELGVSEPLSFEFVEAPSHIALMKAIKELSTLGALQDGQLTSMGKRMAKLPLEPRLAKLALLGIEDEYPFETLAIVSICAATTGIYFRIGSEEEIHRSDLKRTETSMPDGDLISMLNLFQVWWFIEERQKGQWSKNNYLNGKSMKNSRELLREIESILLNEFNFKLNHSFANDCDERNLALRKQIFLCFSNNLCIFSGNNKTGYINSNDYELVHVHPSSALSYLGKLNFMYIVYDVQLTTSRDFILNLTPVQEAWVADLIDQGIIDLDEEKIKKMTLNKEVFRPFGAYVLKKYILGTKAKVLRKLEEVVKEEYTDSNAGLEVNIRRGEISAFFPGERDEVADLLNPILSHAKEELMNASYSLKYLSQQQVFNMQGVLSAGFQIHDVLLQGEFREIIIRDIPDDAPLENIINKFKEFGKISWYFERLYQDNSKTVVISYFSPTSAHKAVEEGYRNYLVQPKGKLFLSRHANKFLTVKMFWQRRKSRGFGFISFMEDSDAAAASIMSNELYIPSKHPIAQGGVKCPISISYNRRVGKNNLKVDLPEFITSQELLSAAKIQLPERKVHEAYAVHAPAFTTTEEDYQVILNDIKQEIDGMDACNGVEVNLLKPRPVNVQWRAFINLDNPNAAKEISNSFDCKQTSFSKGEIIFMEQELKTKIFTNIRIYKVIQESLKETMDSLQNIDSSKLGKVTVEKIKRDENKICINIESNNFDDYCKIHGLVMELVSGHKITLSYAVFMALTTTAKCMINDIQNEGSVFVQADRRSNGLLIYGRQSEVTNAAQKVMRLVDKLETTGQIFEVHLSGTKGLLKRLITLYGLELAGMIEDTDIASIKIDIRHHMLIVRGTKESYDRLCALVESTRDLLVPQENANDDELSETCPICLMDVIPDSNSYRLQYCGHLHCLDCINAQLRQKIVPFVCSVGSCGEQLVIEDFQTLLDVSSSFFQELVDVALSDFVAKNSDRVSFCPVDDCFGIFRISKVSGKYLCQACKNYICTACMKLYHYGTFCPVDHDETIENWLNSDPQNHKLCPKCRAPIEKNSGCNHMQCTRCSSHMCWLCLKIYDRVRDLNRNHYCN